MNLSNSIQFAKLIGAGDIKISEDEDWIRFSCPLAPFTHVKGRDENPSFGIRINDEGESAFNCFTCGSGSLRSLLIKLTWTVGLSVRARQFYSLNEIFDKEVETKNDNYSLHYDEIYSRKNKKYSVRPVPQEVLSQYDLLEDCVFDKEKDQVENYFLGRGIPPHVLYDYEVRIDPLSLWIIFPIIDSDHLTYRLHVKLVEEKTFFHITPKLAGIEDEEVRWGRKDYWFGMQYYDSTKPVILVESETDLLRLRALGAENVLASCGPLNKYKMDRIVNEEVLIGFDSDQAGGDYSMKAIHHFKKRSLFRLHWNSIQVKYYTPKKRIEKLRPAKDAGDLENEEQLAHVLKHKVPVGRLPLDTAGYKDYYR
jgi:5S rRNA maturation endonuclease (ribonuclease M5)